MRSIHNLTTVLGSLAVAWTLALATPGVHVVRADDSTAEEASEEIAEGATCESGPAGSAVVVDSLQRVQRNSIRTLAAQLEKHDPGPGFVALDNRGFNEPRGD